MGLYVRILGEENEFYPVQGAYHFGTLDDHDLGANNGDKFFELSHNGDSNTAFADFIVTSNSHYYANYSSVPYNPSSDVTALRARSSKGVYGVKVFDFQDSDDVRVYHEEEVSGSESRRTSSDSNTLCSDALIIAGF